MQASSAALFTELTPNNSSPDRLFGPALEWCNEDTNLPELNLPCVGASPYTAGARSRHPGGVHVTLCDGSAHFFSDAVDVETWRAMGTIHGEEIVHAR
jgi:prepilin-type processing-associated H-X9-DG protein